MFRTGAMGVDWRSARALLSWELSFGKCLLYPSRLAAAASCCRRRESFSVLGLGLFVARHYEGYTERAYLVAHYGRLSTRRRLRHISLRLAFCRDTPGVCRSDLRAVAAIMCVRAMSIGTRLP